MPKVALKTRTRARQKAKCALTGDTLPVETALYDTDRVVPKADGGIYTRKNTRVVKPVAHMERHGNLRVREKLLDELKAMVDDRTQVLRLKNKVGNQLLAYERRTDHINEETRAWLQAQLKAHESLLAERTKRIEAAIQLFRVHDPLVDVALRVRRLGPLTVAMLTVYVDLAKAQSVSALWKYTGLHVSSHERYQKGTAGGGNKTLRTALWVAAKGMAMDRTSPYRLVYDNTKHRLLSSNKVTQTRNTQGKLVSSPWSAAKPSHRDGAALRSVMKHILADYWMVGRTLRKLPTKPLYAEAVLEHTTITQPEERGWTYDTPKKK